MKPDDVFGDLRSTLAHPSQESWSQLCTQLDSIEDDELFDNRVLPFLREQLKSWPPELRVLPARWFVPQQDFLELEDALRARLTRRDRPGEMSGLVSMALGDQGRQAIIYLDSGGGLKASYWLNIEAMLESTTVE